MYKGNRLNLNNEENPVNFINTKNMLNMGNAMDREEAADTMPEVGMGNIVNEMKKNFAEPENMKKLEKLLGGSYRVKRNLGKGGMGSVYQVFCPADRKHYAAKIINNNELTNGKEEAEILLRLNHHMLPQIREYFTYDAFTIIVMDYINGSNMEEYIRKNGPAGKSLAVTFLRQLADVLLYLHSQEPPVIYRDLKPSNIMVENQNKLRLIDFGTARRYKNEMQNDTMALGTPGYAAPEQLMGSSQSDIRTDIYALGATMYYIVTGIDIGKPPFEAVPIRTVRSGIDCSLEEIIFRCLQKNPGSRFQSVTELLRELDHFECSGKKKHGKNYNSINIVITHSNKTILF